MAVVSLEDRRQYLERTAVYQERIDQLLKQEKIVQAHIHEEETQGAVKRIALVEDMLNLTSCYIILNGIYESMLKARNEDALNDGRKAIYKSIIYMEELVSNYVDEAFTEYEEKLEALHFLDAGQRYLLVRKIGFTIQLLENSYGNNTKWRWSFVDLEGRYAAVAKNIFDLKAAVTNTDPRSPQYEPTVYHLRLIKKLFRAAANRYRQKYELSTNSFDDFKQGITFLSGLRRIHFLMGEREEGELLRKQLDIWSVKLDMDMKRKVKLP
jgi:hypothetical protein